MDGNLAYEAHSAQRLPDRWARKFMACPETYQYALKLIATREVLSKESTFEVKLIVGLQVVRALVMLQISIWLMSWVGEVARAAIVVATAVLLTCLQVCTTLSWLCSALATRGGVRLDEKTLLLYMLGVPKYSAFGLVPGQTEGNHRCGDPATMAWRFLCAASFPLMFYVGQDHVRGEFFFFFMWVYRGLLGVCFCQWSGVWVGCLRTGN